MALTPEDERLVVSRVDPDYQAAMALGRQCAIRYRHALDRLAR